MRDEDRLFQCFPYGIPVFFLGFQRYIAQALCQGLLQVTVLQTTDYLDHRLSTSAAPASSWLLHPIGICPVVALTCPQAFQTLFHSFPERQWNQIVPVLFQVSPQLPDVLFLFGVAGFSFQHIQTAPDALKFMFPDLVMQTVDQSSLPDKAQPLTEFLVHMVPVPEMLMPFAPFR